MNKSIIAISLALIVLAACKSGNTKSAAESPIQFELTEIWKSDTLLTTSESVIFDRKRDILYVTNLNKEPRVKDGNGFISRLSTDGKISDLKWIEGIHSPKGTGIVGDTLYVADIDELIIVDINNNKIARKIHINGAGMLNDITTDSEGNVYISDSDANKIYLYSNGIITEWISSGLNQPNGLLSESGRMLLASMGSMDMVAIDPLSKSVTGIADSLGMADGISYTGKEGYYIVTDWNGEIFMVNPDKTRTSLLNTKSQQINTADCEYIIDKNLLLVPTFFKNGVIAYRLSEKKN
jgi:hypothetical protein